MALRGFKRQNLMEKCARTPKYSAAPVTTGDKYDFECGVRCKNKLRKDHIDGHFDVHTEIPQFKVLSLSSGKAAATPSQTRSHRNFRLLFSKLQSRYMFTRQFSPKVAHKSRDKENITAIYCLRMIDNERGREW